MNILDEISIMVKSAQAMWGRRVEAPNLRRASSPGGASQTAGAGSAPEGQRSWGFGGPAGTGSVNPPVATSTAATTAPAAAKPQVSFGREAQKFLRPLMSDMRARPGAYSNEAVQRFNAMKADFAKQVRDMKANPQKYTEQQQRQILQDWKNKVQGLKGRQKGEGIKVRGTSNGIVRDDSIPSPEDANAGWKQVGRGIQIIPRKGNVGDQRTINRYAARSNPRNYDELIQLADWAAKPTFKNKVRNFDVFSGYNKAVAEREATRRYIAQYNSSRKRPAAVQVASK